MKCSLKKSVSVLVCVSSLSLVCAEKIHEVQKGETLYSISRSYGVSVDSVKVLNNFSGNDIKIGQKIKIPEDKKNVEIKTSETSVTSSKSEKTENKAAAEQTYVVQKGETWFGISRKYGVTVAELQKYNNADSSTSLKVGQKLKIPGKNQSSDVASTKTDAAKNSSSAVKEPSKTESKTDSKTEQKVPDLKKNDPHNYSEKKGDASLEWPVKPLDVTYINGKIGGVCLTSKKDEGVKAIRSGTVMFSGSYRGFGNVVFVQSKTGHIYAYTGLGTIEVAKGDYINYSSQLGTAGVDSYTGKSQVSLMVFQNGQPIDPAKAPRG